MIDEDRINLVFDIMEYDNLTDDEHDLIISFETQWKAKKYLSEKQIEILESIFKKAAERYDKYYF